MYNTSLSPRRGTGMEVKIEALYDLGLDMAQDAVLNRFTKDGGLVKLATAAYGAMDGPLREEKGLFRRHRDGVGRIYYIEDPQDRDRPYKVIARSGGNYDANPGGDVIVDPATRRVTGFRSGGKALAVGDSAIYDDIVEKSGLLSYIAKGAEKLNELSPTRNGLVSRDLILRGRCGKCVWEGRDSIGRRMWVVEPDILGSPGVMRTVYYAVHGGTYNFLKKKMIEPLIGNLGQVARDWIESYIDGWMDMSQRAVNRGLFHLPTTDEVEAYSF